LIDTHIALWSLTDSPKLTSAAWQHLRNPGNTLFISTITIWECAIKFRLNRGLPDDMPYSGTTALERITLAGYELLPISPEHAAEVDQLPLHHGDPFDRLLIAQAKSEPLILLTHDKALAVYGDFVMVV
jgi:PIN domain nuclease of toxin-antitoxin system